MILLIMLVFFYFVIIAICVFVFCGFLLAKPTLCFKLKKRKSKRNTRWSFVRFVTMFLYFICMYGSLIFWLAYFCGITNHEFKPIFIVKNMSHKIDLSLRVIQSNQKIICFLCHRYLNGMKHIYMWPFHYTKQ